MSLQHAAQHLASKGRGGDTMLVHMTPGEVAGLHALALRHGGEVTINPDTGLPEANFLKKILPVVLGAGAMLIPGLQGIGAMGIGAGIGGLKALTTQGSLSDKLMAGLSAGLGAYGGAGIMSSLAGAAAPGLLGGAEGLGATVTNAGQAGMAQGLKGAALEGATREAIQQQALAAASSNPTALTSGVSNLFAGGAEGAQALARAGGWGAMGRHALTLASPVMSAFSDSSGGVPTATQQPRSSFKSSPDQYDYRFNPQGGDPDMTSRERYWGAPTYTPRYAEGGLAQIPTVTPLANQYTRRIPEDYAPGMEVPGYAAGKYLPKQQGRFLRGDGDGVSDSIPAMINGREPAALADGEFVVPARIVSEIGNGSSEAGARKLYAMMDRVQQRRAKTVGKGRVAVDSKSEKVLPA